MPDRRQPDDIAPRPTMNVDGLEAAIRSPIDAEIDRSRGFDAGGRASGESLGSEAGIVPGHSTPMHRGPARWLTLHVVSTASKRRGMRSAGGAVRTVMTSRARRWPPLRQRLDGTWSFLLAGAPGVPGLASR